MCNAGFPATNSFGVACLVVALGGHGVSRAAQPDPSRKPEFVSKERVELFIALLKRRALQALETHQAPPPPVLSATAGLSQGYESNVLLDGERRGDLFTQETLALSLRPRVTPWLTGELTYDLLHSHYLEFRDVNLFTNTVAATAHLQPHRRLRGEVGYELSLVDFPFDTSSSFTDSRGHVAMSVALTNRLTTKSGWTYQVRHYDTRLARDGAGDDRPNDERRDDRHILAQSLSVRWPKTSLKVGGQFYRNFSNDLSQDFYDWEDYQLQAFVSRVLSARWIAMLVNTYERRNYQRRSVPAIAVAERDDLLTVAGSLIFLMHEQAQLSYSLTYRHQDSNDPRLDFFDWINQVRFEVEF